MSNAPWGPNGAFVICLMLRLAQIKHFHTLEWSGWQKYGIFILSKKSFKSFLIQHEPAIDNP